MDTKHPDPSMGRSLVNIKQDPQPIRPFPGIEQVRADFTLDPNLPDTEENHVVVSGSSKPIQRFGQLLADAGREKSLSEVPELPWMVIDPMEPLVSFEFEEDPFGTEYMNARTQGERVEVFSQSRPQQKLPGPEKEDRFADLEFLDEDELDDSPSDPLFDVYILTTPGFMVRDIEQAARVVRGECDVESYQLNPLFEPVREQLLRALEREAYGSARLIVQYVTLTVKEGGVIAPDQFAQAMQELEPAQPLLSRVWQRCKGIFGK